MLRNAFAEAYQAAVAAGASGEELKSLFAGRSLKDAALHGDVAWGKTEAGQSAGLIDDIVPAGALVARLMDELRDAINDLNGKLK